MLLGVVGLRLLVAPAPVPPLRPRRVVAVGVLVYAALSSFITVTRHLTLQTHALDLGYYVQLMWNLARGAGPYVSLPEMHAWGDHFSPILYLLVPLFRVAPGAVVFLVFQSAALALGALAVFAIAARRLGDERPAAVFALLYLLNPSLQGINVRDFHAAALAIPLLLAAIYFAEAERPWPFAVAVLLDARHAGGRGDSGRGPGDLARALEAPLALGCRHGGLRLRAPAGGHAVAHAVLPRDAVPASRTVHASGRVSVSEIVTTLLLHPFRALAGLVTGKRLVYLGALLAPLAFLPLLAPGTLLGLVPSLFENLLGQDPILFDYRTQYQSFVLPFLFPAAIAGSIAWR